MSVLGITSAALALAHQAAPAARGNPELERHLADLVVHLSVLKTQCAALVAEYRELKGDGAADADPAWVVDAAR